MAEFPTNVPNNVIDASDRFARAARLQDEAADFAATPRLERPENISLDSLEKLTQEQIDTLRALKVGLSSNQSSVRDEFMNKVREANEGGRVPSIVTELCAAVYDTAEAAEELRPTQ